MPSVATKKEPLKQTLNSLAEYYKEALKEIDTDLSIVRKKTQQFVVNPNQMKRSFCNHLKRSFYCVIIHASF